MRKVYKITKLDGTDFKTGKIKYEVGKVTEAPDWAKTTECGNGLHLVDDLNKILDITRLQLPCRIFEVKIIGKDYVEFGDKIKCKKLKVVKELSIEEINELFKNIRFKNNSKATLWSNSTAELHANSKAILYDNSRVFIYSKKATFTPKLETCSVIVPYKKIFTFKESQLNTQYRINLDKLKLIEVK